VALPPTWDEYLASLSQNQRRQLKKLRRNLGDEVVVEPVKEIAFPDVLPHLFRLHGERWRSRGESGALAQTEVQEFHASFVRRASSIGVVRMYTVEISGKIIAIWYGFAFGSSVFFYISGMDPEFQEHSPGSALMGYAIKCSIEEGATHFNMLRGAEPYKARWRAKPGRPNTHYVSFSDRTAKILFTVHYIVAKVTVLLRR